jgi:hypothetical protein
LPGWNPNADTYGHSHGNNHATSNTYAYSYGNSDDNTTPNSYAYSYGNSASTDAKAEAHTVSSADAVGLADS